MNVIPMQLLQHAATLAECGRELEATSPGVAELLVLAQREEAWAGWSNSLIDRHPDGADGYSELVTAWQFFNELTERAQVAQAAQQLLVPATSRRRCP